MEEVPTESFLLAGTNTMKHNNSETLNYSIGQKVTWQELNGTIQQGIVINVGYNGLDVIQDTEEIQVPFDLIINHS